MHHGPLIQHIGTIGNIERQFHVLLDQENRGSLRLHGTKQFEHLIDQHRHDAFGRLIEHDQIGLEIIARAIASICCSPPDIVTAS